MIFLNLGLYFFSKELILIFSSKNYIEGFYLVPILGLSYVFSSQYRLFTNVISYYKKTYLISISAIVQSFIIVILNLIFIPIYGVIVVAIIAVFSTFIYTLLIIYFSKTLTRLNINFSKFFILILLFILIVFIDFYFPINTFGISIFKIIYSLLLIYLFFNLLNKYVWNNRLRF